MRYVYAALCVLGILLPYSQMVPWVADNGFDLGAMVEEAGSTRMGAFAWMDAGVAGLTLVAFILLEGRRLRMRALWLPVAAVFAVGVSLGFPLFLLMREVQGSRAGE